VWFAAKPLRIPGVTWAADRSPPSDASAGTSDSATRHPGFREVSRAFVRTTSGNRSQPATSRFRARIRDDASEERENRSGDPMRSQTFTSAARDFTHNGAELSHVASRLCAHDDRFRVPRRQVSRDSPQGGRTPAPKTQAHHSIPGVRPSTFAARSPAFRIRLPVSRGRLSVSRARLQLSRVAPAGPRAAPPMHKIRRRKCARRPSFP